MTNKTTLSEARRLAKCLINDTPMEISLAEAGQMILEALNAVPGPELEESDSRNAFEIWAPRVYLGVSRWALNPELYADENSINAWNGWDAGVHWARSRAKKEAPARSAGSPAAQDLAYDSSPITALKAPDVYTVSTDSNDRPYVSGPGQGLDFYGGTLFPEMRPTTKESAEVAARIANVAYKEGVYRARAVIRDALGLKL